MLYALSQSILSKRLSRDLLILLYSSGELFDAMEIVDGNCAPFSSSNLLYIHTSVDSNVKFEYSFCGVASLNLITVLGRTRKFPVRSPLKASCVVPSHKGNFGYFEK